MWTRPRSFSQSEDFYRMAYGVRRADSTRMLIALRLINGYSMNISPYASLAWASQPTKTDRRRRLKTTSARAEKGVGVRCIPIRLVSAAEYLSCEGLPWRLWSTVWGSISRIQQTWVCFSSSLIFQIAQETLVQMAVKLCARKPLVFRWRLGEIRMVYNVKVINPQRLHGNHTRSPM